MYLFSHVFTCHRECVEVLGQLVGVSSVYLVGSGAWTQVFMLSSKSLYSLSHRASPKLIHSYCSGLRDFWDTHPSQVMCWSASLWVLFILYPMSHCSPQTVLTHSCFHCCSFHFWTEYNVLEVLFVSGSLSSVECLPHRKSLNTPTESIFWNWACPSNNSSLPFHSRWFSFLSSVFFSAIWHKALQSFLLLLCICNTALSQVLITFPSSALTILFPFPSCGLLTEFLSFYIFLILWQGMRHWFVFPPLRVHSF